jgi:hypothetical protein
VGSRVVVTGLFTLAACGTRGTGVPPDVIGNPPAPEAPAPEITPPPPLPQPPTANPPGPRLLNGRDAAGRTILRRSDGACYVNLPLPPPPAGAPVSFQPLPTEAVDCPPFMADPAWAECAFGEVHTQPGSTAGAPDCVCHVFGNPPPPPRKLASCPPSSAAE